MGYDVFFSYARLSNGGGDDESGIVTRLVGELRRVLTSQKSTRAAEIFYDIENMEAGDLHERLTDAVNSSELFVLLLSPRYLNSQWCLRELDTFIKRHGENARNRVFVLDNIPHGHGSGFLTPLAEPVIEGQDALIQFISAQAKIKTLIRATAEEGRRPYPLTTASLRGSDEKDFYNLVVELGDQLARRLNPPKPPPTTQQPTTPPDENLIGVMLGDAGENARFARDALRKHLGKNKKTRLYPDQPNGLLYDLVNVDIAKRHSDALMNEAQLFIQLLGADEEEVELGGFTAHQLSAARKRCVTPLIWAPKGVPDEEFAPHEREILAQGGVERVTPREFRELVNNKIAELAARVPDPPKPGPQAGKTLFFSCIGADRDIAQAAIDASERDFNAFLMPLPDGFEKIEYDTFAEEHYAEADRSFIIGAEASSGWLPRQIRFYVRARRNKANAAPAKVLKPARLSAADIGFLGRAVQFHDAAADRKQTVDMLARLVREACDVR